MSPRSISPTHVGLAAIAAVALTASACSTSNPPSSSQTTATSSASGGEASQSTAGPGLPTTTTVQDAPQAVPGIAPIPSQDVSPSGKFGTRPTVKVPSGSPPASLEAADLIVGTGSVASAGETVTVQYDGYSWTNKKEFDASWNRGQSFSFALGKGQVIPGWDQGVVGMRVGGRRELIIPPNLAYGDQSPTSAIAANDTLIFVIDLVST